ncbi:MAG: DUF2071 domain-containing protein [Haliscomenobacter sp.]|nr:DUF2071 domain-containing protein [Haliscomenobacter sp.]MBK7476477.1 DUF2071 domain-containing protein [Haliscomenobacter sp.]MBK8878465.1 DUF2071 domain-containing protein [Haliscomenobacter sp.]
MPFLEAEWRKLAIANYEIDPSLLQEYVPLGTELDLWQSRCYVSLVGFMFLNTRLLGMKVPFHIHFEEVNLRFYVKRNEGNEWKRGVVFIKEIVPKPAITFVANTIYRENYETLAMAHRWEERPTHREVEYRWRKKGQWHSFAVKAGLKPAPMEEGSETEFITEHYWGYAKAGAANTVEYEVTHPRWQAYDVEEYQISVDFGAVYGPNWSMLTGREPASVMLAEGSLITVENKRLISF